MKAKLKNSIRVKRQDGSIEVLDRRTSLTYLHKHKIGSRYEYWFCVNKHYGSGSSGIGLLKKEFDWIKKTRLNKVTDTSLCVHKGCKNKSMCGDYCGNHCNCRKKSK